MGVNTSLDCPQVDLWCMDLGSFETADQTACLKLLNNAEFERYRGYKCHSARTQFLAARWLLRTTLSRYETVHPEDWQFEFNSHGRPYIALLHNIIDLNFNLSHTRGLAICAICFSAEIGVDTEFTENLSNLGDLAKFVFLPQELHQIELAKPEDRNLTFFKLWTLKEAYVKARGMGFAIPMKNFWLDVTDTIAPQINFTLPDFDQSKRWSFQNLYLKTGHVIGIASTCSPELNLTLRWVKVESFISKV